MLETNKSAEAAYISGLPDWQLGDEQRVFGDELDLAGHQVAVRVKLHHIAGPVLHGAQGTTC